MTRKKLKEVEKEKRILEKDLNKSSENLKDLRAKRREKLHGNGKLSILRGVDEQITSTERNLIMLQKALENFNKRENEIRKAISAAAVLVEKKTKHFGRQK